MKYEDIIEELDRGLLPLICTDTSGVKYNFFGSYQRNKQVALDESMPPEIRDHAMAELNSILHIYTICK